MPAEEDWLVTRGARDDTPRELTDVTAFVDRQLPTARAILQRLRELAREAIPDGEESIKWGVLVVSKDGMICFLDPGRDAVKFGLLRGAELAATARWGELLAGAGKMIRTLRYKTSASIPKAQLVALLRDAAALNAQKRAEKKRPNAPTSPTKSKTTTKPKTKAKRR